MLFRRWKRAALFASTLAWGISLPAASVLAEPGRPTAEQALQLRPIQKDVEYDRPEGEAAARCVMAAEKEGNVTGWVVRDENGLLLRKFLDTNADNKVDLWCYFDGGIEVYRDIDSDFNGKADQYRWLGTAGTRWGLDSDENGEIDRWKTISPEEVTAEVVAALRDRDAGRFRRLLLSPEELKQLGLGAEAERELEAKITAAASGFADFAAQQRVVGNQSAWVHFGGSRPGTVPAGWRGAAKDNVAYENVIAMIETGGKHNQLMIGTLVKVGDNWRAIDLPSSVPDAAAVAGFFFNGNASRAEAADAVAGAGAPNEQLQKLMGDLERLDAAIAQAKTPAAAARLHAQRADILETLAEQAATAEERATWVRQFADMVSAAVQSGDFPEGRERLERQLKRLQDKGAADDVVAHVKFRQLSADYYLSLQDEKANFANIHEDWLKQLGAFIEAYPKSPDAAEAMLQLAIAQEFAGEEEKANEWYAKIIAGFPETPLAKKAAGAKRRLDSVGQVLVMRSNMLNGKPFDTASLRGKFVLVHYWATWCEPCKADMEVIKQLVARHGGQGFAVVGVNLDNDPKAAQAYAAQSRINWPQLYETGGLDSRLANELGILTLPTMLLLDKQGKVVNRNIHMAELEAELRKLAR